MRRIAIDYLCLLFVGYGVRRRPRRIIRQYLGLERNMEEAGIAESVLRLATGWTTEWSEFESRYAQEFSLLYVVQTGSGVHPASYLSRGVKLPRSGGDHSHPTSAEVKKNVDLYIHSPHTPSWRSA
jgi:hypothetical protein